MSTPRLDEVLRVRDQMLDASVDCIKLLDTSGVIQHMNRSGCLALGVTREQAEAGFGMKWLDLLAPEIRPRGRRALRRARAGRVAQFAGRSEGGGRRQEWDNILTPLVDDDGSVMGILCVSRDVTVRRRAEARLRIADEDARRSGRLLALLHDIADRANRAGSLAEGLEEVRRAFERHTGWQVLERGVSSSTELSELVERVRRHGALATTEVGEGEMVHGIPLMPGGAVADVLLVRVASDGLAAGRPEDVVAALARVGQQLSRLLERERDSANLAAARDEALLAARRKATFLAVMSHELRTPMNGVIGLGDMLLHSHLSPQQRRVAEAMQDAGRTLTRIAGDVLELTRLESHHVELTETEFDLHDLVVRAVRLCMAQAPTEGLDVVVDIDTHVPRRVVGDQGRLAQVITNLCGNAVKFSPEGEVRVDLAAASDGDEVLLRLRVSDTGPGVEPAYAERLFEPFVQAEDTIGSTAGSGLGLAITRELVTAMGGSVSLVSTGPHGSVFVAEVRCGRAQEPVPPPPDLRGDRILVAEHRRGTREALVRTLESWGAEVVVATSARTLTGLLGSLEWTAVVVSSGLPGLDLTSLTGRAVKPVLVVPGLGTAVEGEAEALDLPTLVSPPSTRELEALLSARVARPEPEIAAEQRFAGARALVVDDDATNRLVATGLLETLGCVTRAADGGESAVAWLVEHPREVDLVLMDCRMPGVDGYEATRRLRTAGVQVTVLGCTASDAADVRERCLEAGMDDVLIKPLGRDTLAGALATWVPSSDAAEVEPVLDHARVAELRAAAVYDETRSLFESHLDARLRALVAASAAGSAEQASFAAHVLRGAASNIGLPRLAALAGRIEEAWLAGEGGSASSLLAELLRAAGDARTALP